MKLFAGAQNLNVKGLGQRWRRKHVYSDAPAFYGSAIILNLSKRRRRPGLTLEV